MSGVCRALNGSISELTCAFDLAERPQGQGQVNHRRGELVLAKAKSEITSRSAIECVACCFKCARAGGKIASEVRRQPDEAVGYARLSGSPDDR